MSNSKRIYVERKVQEKEALCSSLRSNLDASKFIWIELGVNSLLIEQWVIEAMEEINQAEAIARQWVCYATTLDKNKSAK